jgi:protease I
MSKPLSGQKIAILVANGFDETDMTHAQRALTSLGASMKIVSVESGLVNSWVSNGQMGSWGHHFPTDAHVNATLAADYDGLYVPGGKRSTDKLKDNAHVKRIMRGFFDAGKPMAMLGTSVELLAVCDRAKDCTVTGDPAIEKTMIDAGATWSEDAVCVNSFLAAAQGGTADNALFAQFGEFYAQAPETFKQAA